MFAGKLRPPQTIISVPVQTAVCPVIEGAPSVGSAVQVSVTGSYRAPLLREIHPAAPPPVGSVPPKMIISCPVQITVGSRRAVGAFTLDSARQESVLGL